MEPSLFSDVCCNICNSFLLVAPILIDKEGRNICGSCKNNSNLYTWNMPYEVLANQFSFPCQFAKEGCVIKTRFGANKDHIEECPYRVIKCKCENCTWSGIPTDMILHFQQYHNDRILEEFYLKEVKKDFNFYIVRYASYNFLVEWNYCLPFFTIKVNSLDLLSVSYDKIIFEFAIVIKDSETPTTIVDFVKLNSSQQVELPSLISLSLNIKSSGITKKEDILKEITCPNCSHQMVPPILRCPVGHLTCVNCTDRAYDFCIVCDEDEVWFRHDVELQFIAASTLYKCKWQDCNSYCSFKEIAIHEQACHKRMYMCFHCPQWKGSLDELSHHDGICRLKTYPCPLLSAKQVTVQGDEFKVSNDDEGNYFEYSLIAHKELFGLLLCKKSFGIEVGICNCGPSSCFGWYNYDVVLQHSTDLNLPSKIYTYKYKSNNRYVVEIPNEDISEFGSIKFVKITIQIHKLEGNERKKNVEKHYRVFKFLR